MKAKPVKCVTVDQNSHRYEPCEPDEATHVLLHCPGPHPNRRILVGPGGWTWNKKVNKPTLRPSILTEGGEAHIRCHSYVTNGKIKFLTDCEHELAGQSLDLLDVE